MIESETTISSIHVSVPSKYTICLESKQVSNNIVDINEFDGDPLRWSRDLVEHPSGWVNSRWLRLRRMILAIKALFVGIYDGQN
jgi:hypothetical protein